MDRMETEAAPARGQPPMHPGELLDTVVLPALKEMGYRREDVWKLAGVGRRTFFNIVGGKSPVTPEIALRFGKAFGNGPGLWMELQARWDLAQAAARLGDALDAVPALNAAPA